MSKVNDVKKFINENPTLDLNSLFAHFKIDWESILIASILLGLDYDYLLKEMNSRPLNEDEEIDRIEDYMQDESLFDKVIPQNVHTAFLLMFYQHEAKSKEIVAVAKHLPNYLSDIKKENLFDRPIVFFSTQIDLRSSEVIQHIREKIKNLEMIFIEYGFKKFFKHFDLIEFLSFDEESEKEFLKVVKENYEDAILPGLVHQKAVIEDHCVKVLFDNTYLEKSIMGLNQEIDYKKVLTEFSKIFYDDMKDEMMETAAKYAITNSWEFGMLDVSVKAVKSFVIALSQSSTPLSKSTVSEDHAKFISSGHKDVKSWFIADKETEFKNAMEAAGMTDLEPSPNMFEGYYQKFIERYYVMYGVYAPTNIMPEDHTLIFTTVHDNVFNYSVVNRQLI